MILRKATVQDAEFIATMVMMALHMDIDANQKIWHNMCISAGRDDTLYSWRNTLIAEIDGSLAGICLAYDACDYHEVRLRTFGLFDDISEDILTQADEAGPGEYYLDSIAVVPQYRGMGIAQRLISEAKLIAQESGLVPSLLVDPVNDAAKALYGKMGFSYKSKQFAFGIIYEKWTAE